MLLPPNVTIKTEVVRSRPAVIRPGVIRPGVIRPGVVRPGVIRPGVISRCGTFGKCPIDQPGVSTRETPSKWSRYCCFQITGE